MKISVSNLFNYFSVSGDSKQIKNFPQKSGTTFFVTPLLRGRERFGVAQANFVHW